MRKRHGMREVATPMLTCSAPPTCILRGMMGCTSTTKACC